MAAPQQGDEDLPDDLTLADDHLADRALDLVRMVDEALHHDLIDR
jgi:hypothetical protein